MDSLYNDFTENIKEIEKQTTAYINRYNLFIEENKLNKNANLDWQNDRQRLDLWYEIESLVLILQEYINSNNTLELVSPIIEPFYHIIEKLEPHQTISDRGVMFNRLRKCFDVILNDNTDNMSNDFGAVKELKQKIVFLYELGVIEFLKSSGKSENKIGEILSIILRENKNSITRQINKTKNGGLDESDEQFLLNTFNSLKIKRVKN